MENVKEGWNLLVDNDTNKIVEAVRNVDTKKDLPRDSLGKGNSAVKIMQTLKRFMID